MSETSGRSKNGQLRSDKEKANRIIHSGDMIFFDLNESQENENRGENPQDSDMFLDQ